MAVEHKQLLTTHSVFYLPNKTHKDPQQKWLQRANGPVIPSVKGAELFPNE